ncbi:unnamed protein product, partial [Discosporangium mesarthrocarpum]
GKDAVRLDKERRERAAAALKEVVSYCEGRHCRRAALLGHFGEKIRPLKSTVPPTATGNVVTLLRGASAGDLADTGTTGGGGGGGRGR